MQNRKSNVARNVLIVALVLVGGCCGFSVLVLSITENDDQPEQLGQSEAEVLEKPELNQADLVRQAAERVANAVATRDRQAAVVAYRQLKKLDKAQREVPRARELLGTLLVAEMEAAVKADDLTSAKAIQDLWATLEIDAEQLPDDVQKRLREAGRRSS